MRHLVLIAFVLPCKRICRFGTWESGPLWRYVDCPVLHQLVATQLTLHAKATAVNGLLWLVIEPCVSVIAACLPTYGRLFRAGGGVESMVRSVRSLTSLRSWTSRESRDAKERRGSKSSVAPVMPAIPSNGITGWQTAATTTEITGEGAEEYEMERHENKIGVRTEYDVSEAV